MFRESIQDLSKKVFYHGSELKVEEFKIQPPSPEHPIYITLDWRYAEQYAGENGGIYVIKMARKVNTFDPNRVADTSKVKNVFPRLIRILWFGEELTGSSKKIQTRDLMQVSLELTPTRDATYGSADDERLEDGIVAGMVSVGIMDRDEAEEAIDELDAWLEKFGFDYDLTEGNGYFNQIRTIILKILDKLGYQTYVGDEDTIGDRPTPIQGVFNVDALAAISAKPLDRDL